MGDDGRLQTNCGTAERMDEETKGSVCGGCGEPAEMRCPTCKKLGLESSFFCSQDCFKANWATHKVKHKLGKAGSVSAASRKLRCVL